MPFIDWSDPEEMLGLLIEFVTDERGEAEGTGRRRFLSSLLKNLLGLQERFAALTPADALGSLRAIHRAVDADFEDDPVVEHLRACADELERINEQRAA